MFNFSASFRKSASRVAIAVPAYTSTDLMNYGFAGTVDGTAAGRIFSTGTRP
jgi:hypothetical protein